MANEIQPGSRVVRVPAQRGPGNPGGAPSAMTPKEIFGIIRRHLFMIVFLTILGTCVGGGGWYLMQMYMPKYTSVGTVMVLPPTDIDPMIIGGVQPNKDIYYEFRTTKAFRFRHQGFLTQLLEDDDIIDMQWYKKFDNTRDRVEYLEDNLRASAARDMSHIVVRMTSSSPDEARATAREAIDLFLQQERAEAKDAPGKRASAARDKLKTMQDDLEQIEKSLKGKREATDFSMQGGNFRSYLDETLSDLQVQESALNAEIGRTREHVNILRRRKNAEDFDDIVEERVEQDQMARSKRMLVDSLEAELKRLKSQFGDGHKKVLETKATLEEQRKALAEWQKKVGELYRNAALIAAMEEESRLTAQLKDQERQVKVAREQYRDVSRLRAEYDKDVVKRDEVRAEIEEMNAYIDKLEMMLANETELSKVTNGNDPSLPLKMSSPNILIYIPGGFMLGFMLGIGLAFAVELLNDLLRSPSEVAKYMRVPLLGTICHKSEDRSVKRVNLYHVVREAPYSIMSESYRQFRTGLTLSGSGTSYKTLLVTSGNPGDGKTTVAVNTAYTFVGDGKRVLLIDTNFRKPSTTVLFERRKADGSELEHPDFGLSNYLMGQCDKDSVVRSSGVDNLDLIDSGPLPLNPSELLAGDKMIDLVRSVRQEYDYVIIDGPPLLVSESKILASEVDGTILVFNAAHTRRGAAQRALRELREANANVLGTILIGVKSMKGGYFHEKYATYKRYQKVKPALT